MFRLQSEIRGEQTGLIDEMIGNQKVVQAFGQEEKVTERFDKINEKLGSAYLRATFFSSVTNPATRFINSLVYTGARGRRCVCGSKRNADSRAAYKFFELCKSVYKAV